jgi:hypothetical protein
MLASSNSEEEQTMRPTARGAALAFGMLTAGVAGAQTPQDLQRGYEAAARAEAPGFSGFSAQRGEAFIQNTQGGDWSCSTSHTPDTLASGKHTVTGNNITPQAPAAKTGRFIDAAKVEKWFKRNCGDVLRRDCTAVEKGDVLTYLTSLRK